MNTFFASNIAENRMELIEFFSLSVAFVHVDHIGHCPFEADEKERENEREKM